MMKKELFKTAILGSFSAVGVALILFISLYSPLVMGDDPYSLLRYVLIRLTAVLIAVPVLTGLMVAVDFVTPGDWMKAIGNDSKASAYIMAAVVFAIGLILCWT
jgi:cytochrome bd-type quinol oxidase subunit 1